jgi:serine/threonine protein kinase
MTTEKASFPGALVNKDVALLAKADALMNTPLEDKRRYERLSFLNEVKIMKDLSSEPNIVKVHEGFIDEGKRGKIDTPRVPEGKEIEKMYLIMEMLPNGDMQGIIDKIKGKPGSSGVSLGSEASKLAIKQSLKGLKSVHDKGYLHRDIKPENIMFDANFDVKIVDFGTATKLDRYGLTYGKDRPEGTPRYQPAKTENVPPSGLVVYNQTNDKFTMRKTITELASGGIKDLPEYKSFMT